MEGREISIADLTITDKPVPRTNIEPYGDRRLARYFADAMIGEEGLKYYRTHQPDALFTDWLEGFQRSLKGRDTEPIRIAIEAGIREGVTETLRESAEAGVYIHTGMSKKVERLMLANLRSIDLPENFPPGSVAFQVGSQFQEQTSPPGSLRSPPSPLRIWYAYNNEVLSGLG